MGPHQPPRTAYEIVLLAGGNVAVGDAIGKSGPAATRWYHVSIPERWWATLIMMADERHGHEPDWAPVTIEELHRINEHLRARVAAGANAGNRNHEGRVTRGRARSTPAPSPHQPRG